MKKLIIGVCAVLILNAGFAKLALSQGQTFKLRVHMTHNPKEAHVQIIQDYAKELERRTNGGIKLEIYTMGVLGSNIDSLYLLSSGTVDIANLMGGLWPKEMPLTTILSMPMMAHAPDAVYRTQWELYSKYPPLREEWETKNKIKILFPVGISTGFATSKMPIKTVEDFKGRKIRAFGLMTLAMNRVGATPVTIPSADVYEALQKGVIDGNCAYPFEAIVAFEMYDVNPYIFDWGVGQYANTSFGISLATWNKLPLEYQKIINKMEEEYMDRVVKLYNSIDALALKKIQSHPGSNVFRWAPDEITKARKLIVPGLWNDFVGDMEKKNPNVPIKEFWSKAQPLLEKYQKASNYMSPVSFK